MSVSDDQYETLKRLEESLWLDETRGSPAYMDQLLAADFFEIGASGAPHDRSACLAPPAEPITVQIPLPGFSARELSGDIVQVTYVSVQRTAEGLARALRSSIWSRAGDGWQLRFHQGTPLPAA